MKRIKLLNSIIAVSSLALTTAPIMGSCSCSKTLHVELITKKKDRLFNSKTNGVVYTFKLSNHWAVNNIKVKMVNLKVDNAETKTVSGLLKSIYDSAGGYKVTIKTNLLMSQWPNASNFKFDLEFINKKTNSVITTFNDFTISRNLSAAPTFSQSSIVELAKLVQQVEEKTMTEAEFCTKFSNDDGEAFTSLNDFVGQNITIKLNNVDHVFKVIGVNHDTLVTPIGATTKALFTLQAFTLLQDSEGEFLSKWDSWDENYHYCTNDHQSALYKNLNSEDPSDIEWSYRKNEDRSAYTMLKELGVAPKQVVKQVFTSTNNWATHELTDYNCYCFPLTVEEYGVDCNPQHLTGDGRLYEYWNKFDILTSEPISGSWTTTAITQDANSVAYIQYDFNRGGKGRGISIEDLEDEGDESSADPYVKCSNGGPNGSGRISFAFCI